MHDDTVNIESFSNVLSCKVHLPWLQCSAYISICKLPTGKSWDCKIKVSLADESEFYIHILQCKATSNTLRCFKNFSLTRANFLSAGWTEIHLYYVFSRSQRNWMSYTGLEWHQLLAFFSSIWSPPFFAF